VLRNCTATKACLLIVLLSVRAVSAQPIGTVSRVTGALLVKSEGGSIKVVASGSALEAQDRLFSRGGTYVDVLLGHGTAGALGPDTELTIERISFHQEEESQIDATHQDESRASAVTLRLTAGVVQVTSGSLSTRGGSTFTLAAGSASMDIRKATVIARYVPPG